MEADGVESGASAASAASTGTSTGTSAGPSSSGPSSSPGRESGRELVVTNGGTVPESLRASPKTAPAPPPGIPTATVAAAIKPVHPTAPASLDDPRLYINRELSWLAFNERVLEEGRNPAVPVVERLKFVSILASNLDEFFMVRVAGLKQQVSGEVEELPPDGMSVPEQLAAIAAKVHEIVDRSYDTLNVEILPELAKVGVRILSADELDDTQRKELEAYFFNDVFPILTPLAIDPGHPFPHLRNKSLNLAVAFVREARDEQNPGLGVVQVPSGISRLIPVSGPPGARHYFMLEDLIALYVTAIFPMQRIEGCAAFRVTRNWDLAYDEEEADDLLQTIQQELRRRDRGNAVRLAVHKDMAPRVTSYLARALRLDPQHDVYSCPSPLQVADLLQLVPHTELRELRDEPFQPVVAPILKDLPDNDEFFGVLRERDVLLHQPYDSFESVVELIQRAADDPQVLAIKQTLYRTSGDSPIVRALARAAEQGKQVTAIVELKARFDEESNIQWARALEASGVHVVYGIIGLKTHAKACLVIRREGSRLVRYVHLSTGNYNPSTARLYTDLSLLTSRPEIGEDVGSVFNLLTGYSAPRQWNAVVVAPLGLHEAVLGLIERETRHAREGKPAYITAKLNALVDIDVIKALYRASQAGVRIDLLVRGICCLRPGVKGVSDHIRVRAIVDRFLEHSRVLEVCNDGKPEMYVSSADWMPRNFHRRIELMFPILDEQMRARIHEELLVAALADNQKGWDLRADGTYERFRDNKEPTRSQARAMEVARARQKAAEAQATRVGRVVFAQVEATGVPVEEPPMAPKGLPLARPSKRTKRRRDE